MSSMPIPVVTNAGKRWQPPLLTLLLGNQLAFAFREGTEGVLAWDGADDLVQIPLTSGFSWSLYLRQVHVVDHATIFTDITVAGVHIVYRRVDHLPAYRLRLIGPGGFHGIQIMHDAGIDASLNHGRHTLGTFVETLRPGSAFLVLVPVPASGQLQPLGRFQT